jgi:hypothetical protein
MKIGDEIVCIDNCYARELVNGGKYRIVDIDNDGYLQVQTTEDSQTLTHYYDAGRFDPVNHQEIVVSFGGIKIRLYKDRSVLFAGEIGTDPCSDEEIDDLIDALITMRNS